MNWIMASISLKDNSNIMADTNMYKSLVREGSRSYKSVEIVYKYKLDCYSVPSRVFPISLFVESLSHYIAPHGTS